MQVGRGVLCTTHAPCEPYTMHASTKMSIHADFSGGWDGHSDEEVDMSYFISDIQYNNPVA